MTQCFLVLCSRFLICLTLLSALPACVSQYTVEFLQRLNPAAEVIDTCVQMPTGEPGTSAYAHKISSRETVSDRDRAAFEQFAATADIIYRYDPNAPRRTPQGLPWPYENLTCDTLSSPKTPPLPKGMRAIPISRLMREALVASLSEQYFEQAPPPAAEWQQQAVNKQFFAQPRLLTLPPVHAKEKLDEVSQILRDAIRSSLPTVERKGVDGPTGEQISIIDTETGHVIAGLAAGAPSVIVPGWGLITDAMIAADKSRQPTREFMLGKGITETGVGVGQMLVGGSAAVGGGGASLTGGGALVGVPVCVAGVALATNGAITFYNGAKTIIVAVCHWNELPTAADSPPLALSSLPPPSTGPAPAAAQATPTNTPSSAAKGAKPAAQQATSTPAKPAVAAQAPPAVAAETTTTTRFNSTGKTVKTSSSGTTTTTQVKGAQVPAAKREARLPPKGTPERRVIETARDKGVKLKKAQEVDDIRAGGRGSGVWTESELVTIRKTGEFPKDTQWHHDPTVANRPDLAADPSVVRPVRGGIKGHLEAHGGDFRKP